MNLRKPPSTQPIPARAKRVFHGVVFDVYQWKQKLFDGTMVTFEKVKRAETVVIFAVSKEGNIILQKEEQPGHTPCLTLPGGRVEQGEDPLEAAKRELAEETGYTSAAWEFWESYQIGGMVDWANYLFVARRCERTARIRRDAGERIRVSPVSFDEFVELTKRKDFRNSEIALRLWRIHDDPQKLKAFKTFLMG